MKSFPRLKAAIYILQMANFILFLTITSHWLYKSRRPMCQRFYYNMCSHHVFRVLYGIIFALGISVLNTIYTYVTRDFTCAALTLAVSFPFLFEQFGHPMLQAIRDSRQTQFFLMLIALVAMFTAGLFPFAMALYLLLVAVIYWPSRKAVDKLQRIEGIEYYREHPEELADIYFA